MCWLTPPTTDLNVTSDAYARIFDNLHVCSLKNVSWIKKFEFILVIKKKSPQRSQLHRFQPRAGCYLMCPFDEDRDCVSHFLFLFFRAFHSPSWVAKLPKSSRTFLFLSASLKHTTSTTLEAFPRNLSSLLVLVWYCMLSSPTCSWPRWASLWPGSVSPSWSPSERPWTPSCTCAAVAPSLSPLWCCHASFHSPTWPIPHKEISEFLTDAVPAHWHTSCHVFNRLLTLQRSWAWAASEEWVSSCPALAGCEPQERCWRPPGSHRGAPATKQTPWRRNQNTSKTSLYSDPHWRQPVMALVMFELGDVWKAAFWLAGRCRRRTQGLCRARSIYSPGPGR